MRIATFNVNGITAAPAGPADVACSQSKPDVVCLQELKRRQDTLSAGGLGGGRLWRDLARAERLERRGDPARAAATPLERRRGLPGDPGDLHSRYIEAGEIDGAARRLPLPAQRQSRSRGPSSTTS